MLSQVKKNITTQGEKNQDKCKQILQLQKKTLQNIPIGLSMLLSKSSPLAYSSMSTVIPLLISCFGVWAIFFASVTITNIIIHTAVIKHWVNLLETLPSSEDKMAMDTKHELRIVITPMFFYIS